MQRISGAQLDLKGANAEGERLPHNLERNERNNEQKGEQ